MDLDAHLARLGTLLDREREEERRRLEEARGRLTLRERDARGLALEGVEAKEESGLAGRALVAYGRPDGRPLGGARLGVGSTVRVLPRRGPPTGELPRGVVARRTRARLTVAFDEAPPDWATEGRVHLELEPSAITWERLASGLARLRETAEGRRWHPVLRGEAARFLGGAEAAQREAPEQGRPACALAPEQAAAVALGDRALDLALVHGPPGTGKTTVLIEIVRRAVARGERILASAPSNLAVDNLVERLAAQGIDGVRVGHPARVLPSVVAHTLDVRAASHEASRIAADLVREAQELRHRARKREGRRGPGRFSEPRHADREARGLLAEARRLSARAEAETLSRAQVVLATLTSLDGQALAGRRFDLAVVDEATQAVEPAIYLALLRADRAVLAGDHLQLPPTVLSSEALAGGLGLSLFERLFTALGPPARVTLLEQYRMHEQIMRFPSEALYGGALRAHPSAAGRALDEAPFELVDTSGRGFEEATPEGSDSKENAGEAELVVEEVERVLALGVSPVDVAVISPYDAQVQRLRQLLGARLEQGLEVDTVDGFQGREKEAVVVSLVRANGQGEVGFLGDVRRLNVALTRARRKLVVVGDGATVANHSFFRDFLAHAERAGAWRSAWDRYPVSE